MSAATALLHLATGAGIGAASSVVPGPCSLAVMNAALHRGRRRAVETAIGAGLGDGLCAAAGILGLGSVLAAHPAIPHALRSLGAIALVVYGLVNLHARPAPLPGSPERSGVLVGLCTLAAANPAAVLGWILIVGTFLGSADHGDGAAAAAGIGLGSAGWYALIACLAHRGRRAFHDGMRRLTLAVAGMLVASGCVSLLLSCRS